MQLAVDQCDRRHQLRATHLRTKTDGPFEPFTNLVPHRVRLAVDQFDARYHLYLLHMAFRDRLRKRWIKAHVHATDCMKKLQLGTKEYHGSGNGTTSVHRCCNVFGTPSPRIQSQHIIRYGLVRGCPILLLACALTELTPQLRASARSSTTDTRPTE